MKALQSSTVGTVAALFVAFGVAVVLANATQAQAAAAAQADALTGHGEVLTGRLPAPGAGPQRPVPAVVEMAPSF